MLARLPEKILQTLQEMSISKQNWRGNRLEDIKSQPLFRNIQKQLALGPIYQEKTKSLRTESAEGSIERSLSQEKRHTERLLTPKRKIDLTSTEYGFFQNKKHNLTSYIQDINKMEELNAIYKASPQKSNIETRNSFLDRKCFSSRSGRKSRYILNQENQKTIESLRCSLHPNSNRSQRKKSPKTFEIRSESDSEESTDYNNPSCEILQTEELYDVTGQDFEYNFISKPTKKKSLQTDKTARFIKKVGESTNGNQENQLTRPISTLKSRLDTDNNYKKLKGSLINLINKERGDYYAKNSRSDIESINYLMIKTCTASQTRELDSLKLIDESKYFSPKATSPSFSKLDGSTSSKNKKTSFFLKDKSQVLHVQGNKVKGIF